VRKSFAVPSLLIAAALLLAAPTSPLADVENYKIDPGHSVVGFKVAHILSRIPGRFTKFSGSIAVDPKDITTTKIAVEIDTSTIDTDNADRDGHLKSPDFFDVAKFPKMTYESTGVVANGPNKATVKGNLTLHGVTKPVDLDVEILGYAPDPWGGYRAAYEAKAQINRKDFGLTWNKVLETGGLLVGENVEIALNIEAVREKGGAPSKGGAKSGR
jgi:polyisoprenoid-binding protein YceI